MNTMTMGEYGEVIKHQAHNPHGFSQLSIVQHLCERFLYEGTFPLRNIDNDDLTAVMNRLKREFGTCNYSGKIECCVLHNLYYRSTETGEWICPCVDRNGKERWLTLDELSEMYLNYDEEDPDFDLDSIMATMEDEYVGAYGQRNEWYEHMERLEKVIATCAILKTQGRLQDDYAMVHQSELDVVLERTGSLTPKNPKEWGLDHGRSNRNLQNRAAARM